MLCGPHRQVSCLSREEEEKSNNKKPYQYLEPCSMPLLKGHPTLLYDRDPSAPQLCGPSWISSGQKHIAGKQGHCSDQIPCLHSGSFAPEIAQTA